jgi:putative PIN family toxin of toxin-antitoxin system
MSVIRPIKVVIDTNVLFEGLTKRGGTCGLIIEAWYGQLFRVCLSNALAYEYEDVLSRKLSAKRWHELQTVLAQLLTTQTEFVKIHFSWRPLSPDPGDDHLIDCAMSVRAPIVTSNVRDFEMARRRLGIRIMTPVQFIEYLAL